jgi:hypothetical protein
MIQPFDQLGRRYQLVLVADLSDFAADDPKGQRHESRAEPHDGKKRISVAIAGAGGAENSERRKIGGHHGSQQNYGAEFSIGQKVRFRG